MLSIRLQSAAAEYLTNTDSAYTECDRGICALDKIVVSTPSHLSDQARGFLVPMLYAYWERFFRIAFAEFLRCLTLARVDIEQINTPIARFRIARELSNFLAAHNISALSELAGAHPPASLRPLLKDLHDFLLRPIEFAAPTDWIKTYANVRFRVLEEHCDKFGLEMNRLTQEFTSKSLFQG